MRRIRYPVACSLDGVIAEPDGGFDWIPPEPSFDFEAHLAQFDTQPAIVPVLLGDGLPLPPSPAARRRLSLVRHRVYPRGMVLLEYAVERR